MRKFKCLDLFCGGGGASMGLAQAGFEIEGVDIMPQRDYPFRFHQADAMTFPLDGYDIYWASPPCQAYSSATPKAYKHLHPQLISQVRERLVITGKVFIIENVSGARFQLSSPVKLCGSMFGLPIQRHRYFEIGNCEAFFLTGPCQHIRNPILVTGQGSKIIAGKRRKEDSANVKKTAMQVDWLPESSLTQAIPPAYSKFLGEQILAYMERNL